MKKTIKEICASVEHMPVGAERVRVLNRRIMANYHGWVKVLWWELTDWVKHAK